MGSALSQRICGATMGLLVLLPAASANAAPISKCNAAEKKCLGKYVAAVLRCHAKAEQKGLDVDPACLAKARGEVTGGGKGCFDKLEAKMPNDCTTAGTAASQLFDADFVVLHAVQQIDPSYPAPTLSRCGSARKKCAAKKAQGLMICAATANRSGTADPSCAAKVRAKFAGATGCDVKALRKGPDCLGNASTALLENLVDGWQAEAADEIDGIDHIECGDGIVQLGEDCDPSAPPAANQYCDGGSTCTATCTCPCPTSVHLAVDATSPESVLDAGWTGMAHRMPLVSGADLTLAVSNCAASRPCGTCDLTGPIANVGTTELRNQRCSNDTSIHCTDDAPCLGGGGICAFYARPPFPISAGGIGSCNLNRFYGSVAGTLNVEAGDVAMDSVLAVDVFQGFGADAPCTQCVGDPTANDDVAGGTCNAGPRVGLPCDANGSVPGREDFGASSFDCPMPAAQFFKTMMVDGSSASTTVAKTLTASSPNCADGSGAKCLCETCNDAAAEPCASNADCPDSPGPLPGICGGRRCLGGANAGSGCTSTSECTGGGTCGRAGEPSKPYGCLDDTYPVECIDTDPIDGEGECSSGPLTKTCTAPHAQRPCSTNLDCAPGTCVAYQRRCFLAGGDPSGAFGTATLVAAGAPNAPVADVAAPTLAAVYCVPSAAAAVIDVSAGYPGPARMTAKTTMTLRQ